MAAALPMAMQPVEQATTKTLLQSGVQRSRFMLFFLAGLATWYALLRIAQEDPTVLFFTDGDPRNQESLFFPTLAALCAALGIPLSYFDGLPKHTDEKYSNKFLIIAG